MFVNHFSNGFEFYNLIALAHSNYFGWYNVTQTDSGMYFTALEFMIFMKSHLRSEPKKVEIHVRFVEKPQKF